MGLPLTDRGLESEAVVVLHPGDVACGDRGTRFATLLGSCIAVILTDRRRTTGAMCHIVHAGNRKTSRAGDDTAFGDAALASMYAQLMARGIQPQFCEAFVFGGGNMFPDLVTGGHVGRVNASWVLDALASDGIEVLHQDVGGNVYRRLTWTVGPQSALAVAVAV
jgi:chemotaxis protein CheD